MMLSDVSELAAELIAVAHFIGQRGWCAATAGNFSARIDEKHVLMTRSGCDKVTLAVQDLLICDRRGRALQSTQIPSAETLLHTALYDLNDRIGTVLHSHSVAATVLSRQVHGDCLELQGYEMQKALCSQYGHDESVFVKIFDNNQDMQALAGRLTEHYRGEDPILPPGFLIRGHGLYVWGSDIQAAKRHLEGFEFLFDCILRERLLARA